VAEVGFGLFASPSYLEKNGAPSTPEELTEHDGVIAQIMDGKSLWLMDGAQNMMFEPKRVTFNTTDVRSY